MAATRVRKAFKYPGDDEVEDTAPHEGMDEQEQEELITQLQTSDAESTRFWRLALSGTIALVAIVYLLLGLFLRSGTFAMSALSMALSAIFVDRQRLSSHVLHLLPKGLTYELEYVDGLMILVNFSVIALLYNAAGHGLGLDAPWPAFIMFAISLAARFLLEPVDFAELVRLKYQYKGA